MKKLLLLLSLVLPALTAVTGRNASDFFVSAPSNAAFLIDSITRMDMLDYYRSGSKTTSAAINKGRARVTGESEGKLVFDIDSLVQYQIVLLPTTSKAGTDTIVAVVETLRSNLENSMVNFYTIDWETVPSNKILTTPTLSDWITVGGAPERSEVERTFPFITSRIDISEDGKLTITNTMEPYFVPSDWKNVGGWIKPSLTYSWNGKQFVKDPATAK